MWQPDDVDRRRLGQRSRGASTSGCRVRRSPPARPTLVYGYTAGLGIDIMLMGGLFMRAEWEYIRVTSDIDTNINTVRAGLGYKF